MLNVFLLFELIKSFPIFALVTDGKRKHVETDHKDGFIL